MQDGLACGVLFTYNAQVQHQWNVLGIKSVGVSCRYSQQQIFNVVSQVEHYSEFVPWCVRSTVLKREERYAEAELEVGFQLFVERWCLHIKNPT